MKEGTKEPTGELGRVPRTHIRLTLEQLEPGEWSWVHAHDLFSLYAKEET